MLTHFFQGATSGKTCSFREIPVNRKETNQMRAAVSIPAVASASVLHSAAVGGSVVGV